MKGLRQSLTAFSMAPIRIGRQSFSNNLGSLSLEWESESQIVDEDPERLAKLVHHAINEMEEGRKILKPRELAQIAHSLWDAKFALAKSGRFVDYYLSCLSTCPTNTPIKSLARQYLFHWPENERSVGRIQNFLRTCELRGAGGWIRQAFQYRLFNGEESLPYLAEVAISGASDPLTNLEPVGLRGGVCSGAFVEAIFIEACGKTKEDPSRQNYEKLISFQLQAGSPSQVLRFSTVSAKNSYLDAFLSPWQRRNIDGRLKRWITAKITEQFNDPRLSMGKWGGINEQLVLTFKRWLAQESLEQFLNIVDQSIIERAKRKMWSYRRPFWTSYFNAGYVHEAWVLFGHDALRLAQIAKQQDEAFGSSYGTLRTSDRSQSVLLMRIGDAIIAEWSHNGKCWIWPDEGRAPKLYTKENSGEQCRHAPFEQIHSGAENYRWQGAVANELYRLGIPRTSGADWIPK